MKVFLADFPEEHPIEEELERIFRTPVFREGGADVRLLLRQVCILAERRPPAEATHIKGVLYELGCSGDGNSESSLQRAYGRLSGILGELQQGRFQIFRF